MKKRKLAHSPVPEPAALGGGGFIVDDPPEEAADDEIDYSGLPNLPISHIPTGLQLLDLPPDDEQVLSIFRQAASGWEDDGPNSAGPSHSSQELRVSFEDWRAVCGVLLEHHAEEYAESTDGGGASVGNASRYMSDEGSEFEVEKEGDGGGGSDSADDLSDPDYMDESVPRQRRRRTTGRNKSAGSEDSDSDMDTGDGPQRRMTARQKQTCLDAFALFFPDATPEELPQKKIMISDVQRVAKLLKEKLKAEDVRCISRPLLIGLPDFRADR